MALGLISDDLHELRLRLGHAGCGRRSKPCPLQLVLLLGLLLLQQHVLLLGLLLVQQHLLLLLVIQQLLLLLLLC